MPPRKASCRKRRSSRWAPRHAICATGVPTSSLRGLPPSRPAGRPKRRLKRRLAILNDFQRVALELADWSVVREHYDIDTFDRMIAVEDRPAVLRPYEALVAMRERT